MPALSDRQRIELAIPAYLLYAVTGVSGVFVPASPDRASRAEADIAALRADLHAASLEPFVDLISRKREAIQRRLTRTARSVFAVWEDQPAIDNVMTLWCLLKDLVDREVLILWEGTAMDRAMDKLLPMFKHGFDEPGRLKNARAQAVRTLDQLRAEGLFT